MFKVAKCFINNRALTFAEKCKERSALQAKVMLYASCPAYLQK